jgi:ABC-type transport system involved in multi-copper enzyme maturation permease subunit
VIRTLAWKEVREQRAVWVALAVLAVALVAGLFFGVDPPGRIDPESSKLSILVIFALASASTYGLVCGATTLAGEVEGGTQAFLDTLPGGRSGHWWTKVLTGAALCTAQALFAAGLLLGVGSLAPRSVDYCLSVPLVLVPLTLEAFAWGMLLSAYCRSALAAAGAAAVLVTGLWLLTFAVVESVGLFVVVVGRVLLVPVALAGSYETFCRDERTRLLSSSEVGPRAALLWLTVRQGWKTVLGLAVVASGLTPVLVLTGWPCWPPLTFLAGIVCGLGVFAGEQAGGTFRFLGDRRVPPGRVWWGKTVTWFAAAVLVAVLVGTVEAIVSAGPGLPIVRPRGPAADAVLREALAAGDGLSEFAAGAVAWLVYGFSAGQFCALAFRKTAVAAVVAVFAGGAGLAPWLPSLIMGQAGVGQVLVAPAVLLATTRGLMWPWAAGRLYTGRPLATLVGGGLLAGAAVAAGLWYPSVEMFVRWVWTNS